MPKKAPVTFWKAEEVRDIAEPLISEFHEHLHGETILYLFRSEASTSGGKVTLGKARKVSGLNAYLAFRDHAEELRIPTQPSGAQVHPFYVIEIAFDTWQKLTGSQRIALVDHELSHITSDGLVSHDVEEFRGVLERHGLWKPDLEAFAKSLAETPLFETTRHHDTRAEEVH